MKRVKCSVAASSKQTESEEEVEFRAAVENRIPIFAFQSIEIYST